MIENNSTENKRIAKNTLFMYLRMLVNMIVLLYTSRLILQNLGVSDFGIYNVVGGVVVIFSFVNTAMTSSTSRFLSYALGQKDSILLNKIFASTLFIHTILSLLVFFLCETAGLWYVKNVLVLPHIRIDVVPWVLHYSLFTTLFMIITVPFSSLVMSHERMDVYAYISLFDVFAKLGLAIYIKYVSFDKLIAYSFGLMLISLIVLCVYVFYVKNKRLVNKISIIPEKKITQRLLSFSSWALLGNASSVCNTQGLNLVLNYFFGTIINAAYGITTRVLSAITSLSSGFQVSLNPQIVKTFSVQNFDRHCRLVCLSSKYSFYLVTLISLPIFFNIDSILYYWLGEYPVETVTFVQIMMMTSVVATIGNPFGASIEATGQVKRLSIFTSILNILVLPISFIILYCFKIPYLSFVVNLILTTMIQMMKIVEMHRLVGIRYDVVYNSVLLPIILVIIPSISASYLISLLIESNTLWMTILSCVLIIFSHIIAIMFIGLTKDERSKIIKLIIKKH